MDYGTRSKPINVFDQEHIEKIKELIKGHDSPDKLGVIIIGEYVEEQIELSTAPIMKFERFKKIYEEKAWQSNTLNNQA